MLIVQFIIFQVVVFGAVIYFLKRILYNDTQSAVNRLDKVYQDLLTKQKELTQKIEQAEKEYKDKKDEAAAISEKLTRETMDTLRDKEDKVLKEAKAIADDVVAKARASSDKIRREIEKDVKAKMIDYVAEIMVIGFSPQIAKLIHHGMVREFIGREKDLDFSSVSPDVDKVVIRSAMPLEKEELTELGEMITRKLRRAIKVEEIADKTLIGGLALNFGTLVLDGNYASAIRDASVAHKKKVELEA